AERRGARARLPAGARGLRAAAVTRAGFVLAGRTVGWLASWTYYRNLLTAIALDDQNQIDPVIFVGARERPPELDGFPPGAELRRTPLLDSWTPPWAVRTAARGMLASDRPLGRVLRHA